MYFKHHLQQCDIQFAYNVQYISTLCLQCSYSTSDVAIHSNEGFVCIC